MVWPSVQSVLDIAERQHGVVTRQQLMHLGMPRRSIEHRCRKGRLHIVHRGVYAIGRPKLTVHGRWMAAVLTCGPGAALGGMAAAALWDIRPSARPIEVYVPSGRRCRRQGLVIHRRIDIEATRHHGIPVTTPICTLIDIAPRLSREELEAAINAADKRDLVHPEELRVALDALAPRRGTGVLRDTLDRRTFTLTDSALERHFLPIARRAGLGKPQTQQSVNGYKVDFYWLDPGLVVETHGLRYHRTPAQQAEDRRRDQAHAAAGLAHLRFSHGQIRYEPGHVEQVLAVVTNRLLCPRNSWETEPEA